MKLPDFSFEEKLWKKGFEVVAGADEVGRGSLAGPLVAAAVVFPASFARCLLAKLKGIKINDSKKLSAKQREIAAVWIKENCLAWGIGEVSVSFINKHGIVKATRKAFRKALGETRNKLQDTKIDFLLVDAFYISYTKGIKRKNQLAVVKGDEKSFSIAAASIIAKVYRDKLMSSLARRDLAKLKYYKQDLRKYAWEKNKGYGTKEHVEAIKKYGVTKLHRKMFVRKIVGAD